MRVYTGSAIRNVAVVGHGAAGKTTLVDALAFVAGSSKRHGSVKDGSALTDYTPDEIERQYSISLALAHAEWMDCKVNLIDAPGYLDFIGDAIAAIYAADAALIVVNGNAGVEVGTEQVWEYAEQRGMPRLFFVSMMDKEHADFEKAYRQIKERITPKVLPIDIPVGSGSSFQGVVNLITRKCHMYRKGTKTGEYDERDVPAELKDQYELYEQEFVETVASTDDALLERYLGGEELAPADLVKVMHEGVARGEVYPLLVGAGDLTYGTRALLTALVELVPAPPERPPLEAKTWGDARPLSLEHDDNGPRVAQVFKTVSEPHVGDVSYFRIYSGKIANGADLLNAPREVSEKLNHLSVAQGKDRVEVPELHAGDIGVVAKLRDTHTNDTLSTKDKQIVIPKIPFPDPVITLSVEVRQRGEEDKLSTGLQRLHEEDPTFHHEYNSELAQTLIRGRGERHLEIIVGRLARKYGVHAVLGKPKIAYRETLKGKAEGQGKHKKQTGGRGQYGDCWIRVAPLPRGSGLVFDDQIVGGVIPRQYIPAVEKGIVEAAARGPVAGYPMVDFKVELFDGSYHDVDSNEMSFKMAGIQAFRNVTPNARPVLLEPIVELEALTPDEYLGAVMGDLSSRRGQILGTEPDGRVTKIKALVPEAELDRYATHLHSITHGRGTYRQKFHAYHEVPPDAAQKVVEARTREKEETAKAS